MQIEWYGQSAFRLSTPRTTVFIDPFGDMSPMAGRGIRFDYPAIEGVGADVLLVTHEHLDHNAVEVIDGEPTVLRSTAGRLESPIGGVVAIASEHDEAAGTERGPNTILWSAAIVEQLQPRWVVPMHYRTPGIGFLEPADDFIGRMSHVHRLSEPAFDTAELDGDRPLVVVPAAP